MYIRHSLYMTLFLSISPLIAQVHELSTVDQYNAKFNSDTPMITMYSMVRCGPCKSTKPHFISLASSNTDINFCLVDTDNSEFDDILNAWEIRGVPCFIFSYKGQKVLQASGGMGLASLEKYLNEFRDKLKTIQAKESPKKSQKNGADKKAVEKKETKTTEKSDTPATKKSK